MPGTWNADADERTLSSLERMSKLTGYELGQANALRLRAPDQATETRCERVIARAKQRGGKSTETSIEKRMMRVFERALDRMEARL